MSSSPQLPTYAELAEEVLLRRIRDYPEEYYCAGWLRGLEFLLWEEQHEDGESFSARARSEMRGELHPLAEIAGGWWVHKDETQPGVRDLFFIPMERWQGILKARDSP